MAAPVLRAALCRQPGSMGQFERTPEVMTQRSELDKVMIALGHAQAVISNEQNKWLAEQYAVRDERDQEIKLLDRTRCALQERIVLTRQLEVERDAAQASLHDERKKHASLFKTWQERLSAYTVQVQRFEAKRDELKRDTDAKLLALTDEKTKLEAKRDELKRGTEALLLAFGDEKKKLVAERDELVAERDELKRETDARIFVLNDEKTKLEAERDELKRETDAQLRALNDEKTTLEAERDELKRETDAKLLAHADEKAKLLGELDSVRLAILHTKTKLDAQLAKDLADRRKATEKLFCIEGERNALRSERDALRREKDALKFERDEAQRAQDEQNVKLKRKLVSVLSEKKLLERELVVAGEEMVDKKLKMEQEHETMVEQMRENSLVVKGQLSDAESNIVKLENELVSMKEERSCLQTTQARLRRELEEEKENSLCKICLESIKDTMPFPCLHFHFCSPCLDKHRMENKTCPSCRGAISGVLRCVIIN